MPGGGESEVVCICATVDSSCPEPRPPVGGEAGPPARLPRVAGEVLPKAPKLRGDEEVPRGIPCFAGERAGGLDTGGELAHRELFVLRSTGIGCDLDKTSSGSGAIWGTGWAFWRGKWLPFRGEREAREGDPTKGGEPTGGDAGELAKSPPLWAP